MYLERCYIWEVTTGEAETQKDVRSRNKPLYTTTVIDYFMQEMQFHLKGMAGSIAGENSAKMFEILLPAIQFKALMKPL